jgi:membrane protease YdiL (CAAX protease family)
LRLVISSKAALSPWKAYPFVVGLYLAAGASHIWGAVIYFVRLSGVSLPHELDDAEPWIEATAVVATGLWLQYLSGFRPRNLAPILLTGLRGLCVLFAVTAGSLNANAAGPLKAAGHTAQMVLLAWLALVLLARADIRPRDIGIGYRENLRDALALDMLLFFVMWGVCVLGVILNNQLELLPGPDLESRGTSQDKVVGVVDAWSNLAHSLLWSSVVEELVVTAAVVALLSWAKRPLWEILLIAALMRFVPHLYMGIPAFAHLPLGIGFAWVVHRYGRVIPLVLAHAFFNLCFPPVLPAQVITTVWGMALICRPVTARIPTTAASTGLGTLRKRAFSRTYESAGRCTR